MSTPVAQGLKLGRISGVHGIKGWVKVHSYTQPLQRIIEYQPWTLVREGDGERPSVVAVDAKFSGKVLVVALEGFNDRDQALSLVRSDIWVAAEQIPALAEGEYYWYQLEGLRVVSRFDGISSDLGRVEHLLETGANDVLVVKGDQHSIDQRERLIPYLKGSAALQVDLEAKEIRVDWDPAF